MPFRLALLATLITCCACDGQHDALRLQEFSGHAMGTTFNVKIVSPASARDFDLVEQQLVATLDRIDQRMSTWKVDSELSVFNSSASTEWIDVSAELCAIMESAIELSRFTAGAFDVTVGPLVNLWGFGPGNEVVLRPPEEAEIAAAMARVGYDQLRTDCSAPAARKSRADVYVDLSAYAKGYAVDALASALDESELDNYLVEIGGELRARGRNASGQPWAIAIEKPADFERSVQSVIRLIDRSMATSGDYRNFFMFDGKRFSHTIDARRGRPVTHDAAAVTVISESAATADALATALLVLGPQDGFEFAERERIAACFLLRNGNAIDTKATTGFAAVLSR